MLYPRHCNLIKVTIFPSPSLCIIMLSFFFPLSKYLPKHKLPENVIATTDAKSALLGADYCLHSVPVQVSHFPCFCWWFSNSEFDSNFYDDFSAFHIFTTWCSLTTDCYSNLFTPSTIQYFMFPRLTLCIKQGHCLILISFLAVHLIFSWGHCRLCRSLLAIHLP